MTELLLYIFSVLAIIGASFVMLLIWRVIRKVNDLVRKVNQNERDIIFLSMQVGFLKGLHENKYITIREEKENETDI